MCPVYSESNKFFLGIFCNMFTNSAHCITLSRADYVKKKSLLLEGIIKGINHK